MDEQFQVLHIICALLPFVAAVPATGIALKIALLGQRVRRWPQLILASIVGFPALIFAPGLFEGVAPSVADAVGSGPSAAVAETLMILAAATVQKSVLGSQRNLINESLGYPEEIEDLSIRDPEGEAELAERHDAVLRAWISADMAGGREMVELVETASHWSEYPGTPEYRRAVEMLEEHWEHDLDRRIDGIDRKTISSEIRSKLRSSGLSSKAETAPRIRTYGDDPGIGTFGAGWYDTGDDDCSPPTAADSYHRLMTTGDDEVDQHRRE